MTNSNPNDEGQFLYHTDHDKCGSSDALAVYDNGTGWCFSCEGYEPHVDIEDEEVRDSKSKPSSTLDTDLKQGTHRALPDRGITLDTCRRYGVTTKVRSSDQMVARHFYPYYKGGEHTAYKVRDAQPNAPKKFKPTLGNIKGVELFGQHLFPKGSSKYLTITEGEIDAMAAYQMQGSEFASVSIVNGSTGAERDVKRNLEWVESFDNVVLCFDNDEPGQKAAVKVAALLSPGKAKICKLDPMLNDAGGYLQAGEIVKFKKDFWKAERWTPSGIVMSSALKDRIRNRTIEPGIPYPWEGLNKMLYGMRRKEIVLLTALQKVGKTAICKEVLHSLVINEENHKVGAIFLEETAEDLGLGLMSIEGSIPFHLPDAEYTDKQYDQAEKILDTDRVVIYDHQGDRDLDNIVSRIRYMVKAEDCDYIFLDNLSVIDSGNTRDKELLDLITKKMTALRDELDVGLILVTHLNRQGQVYGSSSPEKFCNIHVRIERDKEHKNKDIRNTTFLTVADNRFCGRTGPACALAYDEATGRLTEVNVEFPSEDDELQLDSSFFEYNEDELEIENGEGHGPETLAGITGVI